VRDWELAISAIPMEDLRLDLRHSGVFGELDKPVAALGRARKTVPPVTGGRAAKVDHGRVMSGKCWARSLGSDVLRHDAVAFAQPDHSMERA